MLMLCTNMYLVKKYPFLFLKSFSRVLKFRELGGFLGSQCILILITSLNTLVTVR